MVSLGPRLGYDLKHCTHAARALMRQVLRADKSKPQTFASPLAADTLSSSSSSSLSDTKLTLEQFTVWLYEVVVEEVQRERREKEAAEEGAELAEERAEWGRCSRDDVRRLMAVFDTRLLAAPAAVFSHYARSLFDAFTSEGFPLDFGELLYMGQRMGAEQREVEHLAEELFAVVMASPESRMTVTHFVSWLRMLVLSTRSTATPHAAITQRDVLVLTGAYGANALLGVRQRMADKDL